MIRTYEFACKLNKTTADGLNRESGRIYTETLVWHYRIYRRAGIWLPPSIGERLNDFLGGQTTLHAHSRDAAQQGFYKACKVAKANRGIGAKYPNKRKFYRTTVWKNTGIRLRDGKLLLARARDIDPIIVALPNQLRGLPKQAFLEIRLVYNQSSRKYCWHAVIEDSTQPNEPTGDKILAIDLGEIHPMAVANENGEVVIVTARELRAVNQYRHKRLASLQSRLSKCKKDSRLEKKLKRRKAKFLAKNKRQARDIEHKITRAVTNYAKSQDASRVVVGDIRDIADGKRLRANAQQKISGWSHGKQVDYLTYKLAEDGIELARQDESWSSKTCPCCGAINKPNGRNYKCSACGFVGHRDGSAACNQESKALFGCYSRIQPTSIMYLRPFNRRSSSSGHLASRLA